MQLKVIGTGSKGNAYLLENKEEALLIECGVGMRALKSALNFSLNKLVGCIVTHEHMDHAKSVKELMATGVDVFASAGTLKALGVDSGRQNYRAKALTKIITQIVNFKVMRFDVEHDAAEPCGFIIHHPETGNVLFLTDAMYSKYTFKNLNNIIIEANYDTDIAKKRLGEMEFLRNRIIKSHMSIGTCVDLLKANDLSKVNNIVLIHLSDTNSNAKAFKESAERATNKHVTVAYNGLVLDFNKTPF